MHVYKLDKITLIVYNVIYGDQKGFHHVLGGVRGRPHRSDSDRLRGNESA